MIAKATPKFFKSKLPVEENMEFFAQESFDGNYVRIFLREENDSDRPSRVRITITKEQAKSFGKELLDLAV